MAALLGLELSPDPCSLALLREDGQIATRQFGGERGRALLHEIDGLMREAGTERAELRGIVVGIGPGSYTGLRIACTAARSLAYALEIPVGGISSFDAAIAEAGEGITHVVLDAYRGEVYHGTGACAQGEVRITQEPRVCQLDELELQDTQARVVCDPRLREALTHLKPQDYAPRAARLLELAVARGVTVHGDGFEALTEAEPMYLRAAAFRPGQQG